MSSDTTGISVSPSDLNAHDTPLSFSVVLVNHNYYQTPYSEPLKDLHCNWNHVLNATITKLDWPK